MRGRALLFAVALLGTAGLAARAHAQWHGAVRPLPCGPIVGIVDRGGERLACAGDPELALCPGAREGRRYQACRDTGPVRGALLRLHGEPIDVDDASLDDLTALPGVGPGLALRIDARRRIAPFCRLEDLRQVRGIGPKRLQALAGHVAFGHSFCATPATR